MIKNSVGLAWKAHHDHDQGYKNENLSFYSSHFSKSSKLPARKIEDGMDEETKKEPNLHLRYGFHAFRFVKNSSST